MQQTIGVPRYEILDEIVNGRCLVRLLRPLVYRLRIGNFRLIIAVPKEFISDLTSIPRLLWPFFPPDGPYLKAAIFHDYLYSIGAPRWLCDSVFRHVMEATNTPRAKRVVLFYGVRFGGWVAWRRHRRLCT